MLEHVVKWEIGRPSGKVFAFFIDLKASFDMVVREELWKRMSERGVGKGLIERVKEIYEETENVV